MPIPENYEEVEGKFILLNLMMSSQCISDVPSIIDDSGGEICLGV